MIPQLRSGNVVLLIRWHSFNLCSPWSIIINKFLSYFCENYMHLNFSPFILSKCSYSFELFLIITLSIHTENYWKSLHNKNSFLHFFSLSVSLFLHSIPGIQHLLVYISSNVNLSLVDRDCHYFAEVYKIVTLCWNFKMYPNLYNSFLQQQRYIYDSSKLSSGQYPFGCANFGKSRNKISRSSLCDFTTDYRKRLSNEWAPIYTIRQEAPYIIQPFEIYHTHLGQMPNYTGHIPGAQFRYGKTYGNDTIDAKRWLRGDFAMWISFGIFHRLY